MKSIFACLIALDCDPAPIDFVADFLEKRL